MSTVLSRTKAKVIFHEFINAEIEPFVYGNWVDKINRKGEKDLRYFAVTYAQMYLCKPTIIGNSIKISHAFPLVNLRSVSSDRAEKSLTFVFTTATLTIVSDAYDTLSHYLMNLFYGLFPDDFTRSFDLQLNAVFSPPARIPQMFCGMFLSFNLSFGYSINENFIESLKEELRDNPTTIDFTKLHFDKKSVSTILCALELTKNIKSLIICESKYFQLYKSLTRIVNMNKNIEEIKLCNAKSTDNFDHFLIALSNSAVVKLSFESSKLTLEQVKKLMFCEQSHSLKKLSFVSCMLNEKKISFLFNNFQRFNCLNIFELCDNKNTFTPKIMDSLTVALSANTLTTLSLSGLNMNIRDFITNLSGNNTSLETIDLSYNIFSSLLLRRNQDEMELVFPPNIKMLNFSNTECSIDSLLYMLYAQKFNSECIVDFSNIKLVDAEFIEFFRAVDKLTPCESSVAGLIWRDNPLDPRLVLFMARNNRIEHIDFSKCFYESIDYVPILNTLVFLVHKETLTTFKFSEIKPNQTSKRLFDELLPILQSNPTITTLDLSYNAIGDKGIEKVQKIIETAPELKSISFDGSSPTNQNTYLTLLRSFIGNKNITFVQEPVEDIKVLEQMQQKPNDDLENAWITVTEICHDNKKNEERQTESIESFQNFMCSIQDESSVFLREDENLDADWFIQFPRQKEGLYNQDEWLAMESKYSLSNISKLCLTD